MRLSSEKEREREREREISFFPRPSSTASTVIVCLWSLIFLIERTAVVVVVVVDVVVVVVRSSCHRHYRRCLFLYLSLFFNENFRQQFWAVRLSFFKISFSPQNFCFSKYKPRWLCLFSTKFPWKFIGFHQWSQRNSCRASITNIFKTPFSSLLRQQMTLV